MYRKCPKCGRRAKHVEKHIYKCESCGHSFASM